MTEVPSFADAALWIVTSCGKRDYLLGNPHTFRGRMSAYCPHEQHGYAVGKSEIVEMSPEAARWVEGFLRGNEPDVPVGEDGREVDADDRRYAEWEANLELFRESGEWPLSDAAGEATATGIADSGARYVRSRSPSDDAEVLVVVSRPDDESVTLAVAVDGPDGPERAWAHVADDAARAVLAALAAVVPAPP